MATITANAVTANWNTTGAWSGAVIPTAADDVVLPASASITIPGSTTVVCRSLTVQASATLTWAATTSVLNIGTSTAGAGNVALSVSASASIVLTAIGAINFVSTSATQQTITSGGKTFGNSTFSGVGSSYVLGDVLNLSGSLTITNGTFSTSASNYAVTAGTINCSASTARTLALGSSTLTASASSTTFTFTTTTNLTVSANTATFVIAGSGTAAFGGFNMNGAALSVTSSTTAINTPGTWASFTYSGPANKNGQILWQAGQTATFGTFTALGNSLVNRAVLQSTTLGTAATINATTWSLQYIDFQDIAATGTTATGTSLGDALGNSGITFPASVARYAVAAGAFSSTATWSTSNGGSAGASAPLPQDDVYLTSLSPAGTYTLDTLRTCRNLDCTGFTRTLAMGSSVAAQVFGNFTLSSSISLNNLSGSTMTLAGRGAQTMTMNGATIAFGSSTGVFQILTTGSYTMQDAFTQSGGQLKVAQGTLNTNGFTVTTPLMVVSGNNTRAVNLSSSTVALTGTTSTGTLWDAGTTTGLTFTPGTSTISITAVTANARTFTGGGLTYATLSCVASGSSGAITISGSNTFNTINFSDATGARTLTLTAGTTQTITNAFNVNGGASRLITIGSTTTAAATLSYTGSGVISCDYLYLTHSAATPANTWYAGTNSTNDATATANSGWIFTAPPATFVPLVVSCWW